MCASGCGIGINGNRFDCQMSLDSIIAAAYRIKTSQIEGADWLSSQRFEIHAIIPDGTPKDQYAEFVKDHIVWLVRNSDFAQSMNTPEKARAYVEAHIND